MSRVIILLSSFNGEQYIKEQLESIFNQRNVEIHLVVRDDGSTDKTRRILDHYKIIYPTKLTILKGENIGWRKSFFYLIKYAYLNFPNDTYFAFSDQDDIWLPHKLSSATSMLEGFANMPTLYCSNLISYSNGINKYIINRAKAIPTFKNCLARNYATGCTIVLNNNLLTLLNKEFPNLNVQHDYWAYMVAVLCGKVIIDPSPHILYRQHTNNQIGSQENIIQVWKRRIKDVKAKDNIHRRQNTAQELLRIFKDNMHPDAMRAVSCLCEYNKTFFHQLRFLFQSGYTLGNIGNDFFFKLRILFGIL